MRLVVGAAAERPDDVRVAQRWPTQLDAAGIDATVVAPTGVELFGRPTVAAIAAEQHAAEAPTGTTSPPTHERRPARRPPPTDAPPPRPPRPRADRRLPAARRVGCEPDLMVLPRTVGR